MIIDSLKVNFRKFKDAEFKFGNNINIITGHNGTMKSTVLGLIAQPFNNSRSSSNKTYDNIEYKSIDNEKLEGSFSKNFKFSYPMYDSVNTLKATLNFKPIGLIENDTYSFESILRSEKGKAKTLRVWKSGDKSKGSGFIKDIPIGFLYLDRLFPIGKIDKLNETGNALDIAEFELYKKWYSKIFPKQVGTITSVTGISSTFKSTAAPTYTNRDYNTISAGEDVVGKILITILGIIKVSQAQGAGYKGGILIIDEIESSLHPPAQIQLMKLLNKISITYQIQCFFTTHSIDIIEWAFKMNENNSKDIKTKDNISFHYLEDYEYKINILRNPEYLSIKNHLRLSSDSNMKIKVYVEDEEAAIFVKNFLCKNYLDYIDIIITEIGCKELARLSINKKIGDINESLVILDGDSKKDFKKQLTSYNVEESSINNVIFLPSDKNPENYIIDYLDSIGFEHEFWMNNINRSYSKDHFIESVSEIDKNNRVKVKEWFKNNICFFGENCNKLFEYLVIEKGQDYIEFNESFVKSYNILARNFLINEIDNNLITIPKSKDYLLKSTSSLQDILEYYFHLSNSNNSNFHLKELDFDIYNMYKSRYQLTKEFKKAYPEKFNSVGNGRLAKK